MNQEQLGKTQPGPVQQHLAGEPALHGPSQDLTGSRGVRGSLKKRVCFDSMAVDPEEPVSEFPRKRLRPNSAFMMQVRCFLVPPVGLDLVCLDQLCLGVFANWHASTGSSSSRPTGC